MLNDWIYSLKLKDNNKTTFKSLFCKKIKNNPLMIKGFFWVSLVEGRLCKSFTNSSRTVYNRDIQELAQNGVQ